MSCVWSASSDAYPESFEEKLKETIARWKKIGVSVMIVLDVAEQHLDPPSAASRRAFWGLPLNKISVSNNDYLKKNGKCNQAILRQTAPGVIILDVSECFVDQNNNWVGFVDGDVLYQDKTHLSDQGSKLTAPLFSKSLKDAFNNRKVQGGINDQTQ